MKTKSFENTFSNKDAERKRVLKFENFKNSRLPPAAILKRIYLQRVLRPRVVERNDVEAERLVGDHLH